MSGDGEEFGYEEEGQDGDAATATTDGSGVRLDVHSMAEELAALRSRVVELETNAPRGYLEALERGRSRSRALSAAQAPRAFHSVVVGEAGDGPLITDATPITANDGHDDEFVGPGIDLTQPVL